MRWRCWWRSRWRTGAATKAETLREASGRLDALRITLRLGKHLGFVSNRGYVDLAKGTAEVGRMLGGWPKSEQGATAAPVAHRRALRSARRRASP